MQGQMTSQLHQIIAFIPLSIHGAYAAATASHLPANLGRTVNTTGTPTDISLLFWILSVGACNLAFVLLYLRMPRFKDTALTLPGLPKKPLTPERRAELVQRLRGVARTAILGLNLFFLAVYQAVYQANVGRPIVRFPVTVLFVGFMVVPLLLIAVHVFLTVHGARAGTSDDTL